MLGMDMNEGVAPKDVWDQIKDEKKFEGRPCEE